jgi:hypothetical protein
MVAAVAYAIATREERQVSQEKSVAERFGTEGKPMVEKVVSRKKHASIGEPRIRPQSKSPPRRAESLKRPTESRTSSKWFSGKEPIDDGYDEQPGGISV